MRNCRPPWPALSKREATKPKRPGRLASGKRKTLPVWTFAQTGAWIVVTKDEDFAERALRSQTGPQVLWLRIGNSTNRVLLAWLEPLLPGAVKDLQSGHRLVELRRA